MSVSSASIDLRASTPKRSGVDLLLSVLHAQRRPALFGVLAGVAWSVTKLTAPVLVRRGIDLGIRARDNRQLTAVVAGLLLLGIIQAGLAGFRRYFAISLAARVETHLRARLFVHLLRLDLAFHARTPAGQLVSRCASDLQQIQQPFASVPMTVSNAVMLVAASVTVWLITTTPSARRRTSYVSTLPAAVFSTVSVPR